MANQPETSSWSTGVYQWEVTDPAQGGIGGVMNTPILQLASRTRWLKDQVDTLAASISGGASLNSPNFIGNPTAPTASQFDNDTSIATTAFVQRALGNLGGVDSYNASFTLIAAQAGRGILYYGGADASAVLPLSAACPVGAAFLIHNVSGFTLNLQRQGSDALLGVGGATSVALGPGDSLLVANQNAAGQWTVAGGSAQYRYSYSASLKANTSGTYSGLSVGYATSAGNSNTLGGWDRDTVRSWNNLLNVPPLVYPDGGTYAISISGNSNYANSAGTLTNSPGNAPHYAVRAWVNFNGVGTVSIRSAGNVSSVTDLGTGQYRLNYSSAMPHANYAAGGNTSDVDNENSFARPHSVHSKTIWSCDVHTRVMSSGNYTDVAICDIVIVC